MKRVKTAKDWRELLNRGTISKEEITYEYRKACDLGILCYIEQQPTEHEPAKHKIYSRFNGKYTDVIYEIGQKLIEKTGGQSYLDLPVDLEHDLFFTRIEQVLEAYVSSGKEFLPYHSLVDSVARFSLVPNMMIQHGLLVKKKWTPDNEIPTLIEYALSSKTKGWLEKTEIPASERA